MSRAHRPGRVFYSLPDIDTEHVRPLNMPTWVYFVNPVDLDHWELVRRDLIDTIASFYAQSSEPQPLSTDNASSELVDLARQGQRQEFEALASCLMPTKDILACWRGTRVRLGLEP